MLTRHKISATLRRQIAARAGSRCSYCRSPELAGVAMVLDHIIPLIAGGASDSANLCLACYRCNEFKGARIEGQDLQSGASVPLFNPHLQAWRDHFAWSADGLRMIGRTPCGRATIATLYLNSDWLIQARRIWIMAGIHPPLE
ncbi:MAG: HNH endonuclease [Chloroflexi bacterium]|nr:HNH endonuclease [Chloroflexota bacterium]